MQSTLKQWIRETLGTTSDFSVEYPSSPDFGDYSTNVAMVEYRNFAKAVDSHSDEISWVTKAENPRKLAELFKEKLENNKLPMISKIEVMGPGFINFFLTPQYFAQTIITAGTTATYGAQDTRKGQKIIIEYTDPNPFKEFHIGHLMSNTIGESLSRIIENEGADIKRLSYGGDVGLHTAKSIFAVQNRKGDVSEVQTKSKKEQVAFWAECYVAGSTAYLDDPIAKNEIDNLNKIIFDKDDAEINELYDWGREVSIYHFQEMFKRLDSHFYRNFWESEVIGEAMKAVNDGLNRKILEHSEGAVIFRGEDHGLHTRVFVNSKGVPTYEAKELGLGVEKYKLFHFDQSVVITGNEQNEYFKVVLRAMELLLPEVAGKTVHVGHGMLRLPEGKMSSRKGNVIVAEDLLNMVVAKVQDKMKDRDMTEDEKEKISEMIAIGAVRYSILRQAPGKDIAFDFDTSISFEGDSGPYLQYSVVRARSAVQKSTTDTASTVPDLHSWQTTGLEKQIEKYPRVVARAGEEFAPQYITTYLTELAGEFNSFYAHHKINDDADPLSSYKLAITKAFIAVMTHGLHLLGIKVPERM